MYYNENQNCTKIEENNSCTHHSKDTYIRNESSENEFYRDLLMEQQEQM